MFVCLFFSVIFLELVFYIWNTFFGASGLIDLFPLTRRVVCFHYSHSLSFFDDERPKDKNYYYDVFFSLKKKHLIVALRVLFFVLLLFVSVEGQSPRRCVRVQSLRKQVQYTPFPFKRKKKKIIFVFFFYLLPFVFTTVFFCCVWSIIFTHHAHTYIHTHNCCYYYITARVSYCLFLSYFGNYLRMCVLSMNLSLYISSLVR